MKKQITIGGTRKSKNVDWVIDALENVSNHDFVKNSELFGTDFKRIIDRLKDDSFRLAVVGEFSSGKSTFLNALIGRDLLKHGAQETTATVTEIHNKNTEANEAYLDVYFSNGDVIQKVSVDQITEYTATASTTYSVAKEIDRVVINCKILESDAKVCFVDTPGLNGVADNHREKTIEQIKNAHACIYLMQVRGLGQSDIEFLRYISKYQHNIVFVQNFIDELKRLEGETPEQKVEEQKRIIEEKIIKDNDAVHYEILAVSSRKALISRSADFKKYNDETINDEMRERLYEESHFDDVFTVINQLMVSNEREKTQQKDAVVVALNILEQLRKVVALENQREISEWERSIDGRNAANYSKLIDSLNENKDVYVKKLDNYVEAEASEIRKENEREIEEGLQKIEEDSRNVILEITGLDELEQYIKKVLPWFLYQHITAMDEESINHMNIRFENMVANAVLRIKQYTGMEAKSADLAIFGASMVERTVESFSQEEDEIVKLQRELSEKRLSDENADKVIREKKSEIREIDSDIVGQKELIRTEKLKEKTEISKLGAMPEKETKYRTETYYEYRGGLGVLDTLFGPKERTRSVSYMDDSKQKAWKKQKSDIETMHRQGEDQINTLIRNMESRKRQCDEEIRHLKATEVARKKDIQRTQSLLEAKMDYLRTQKEKARQEYLREAKRSILQNVRNYLQDTVREILFENHNHATDENTKRARKIINSLFAISYENRIRSLQKLLHQSNGMKDTENTSDLLALIENTKSRLETFLWQQ